MHSVLQDESYRVLSIQSHMVSGYCGNKAAVFPLQTLGFDVDILNTVQFSNHTGYPSWTGGRLNEKDVQDLFDGLERNGLTGAYTHILTGYIGNYAILETIEHFVQKLKATNPDLVYVCDPVMGDWGRLYVAQEIVPLYRNIMRISDVATPNQFEAEVLTEIKIDSLATARQAAQKLHEFGVPNVVITTLKLPIADVPEEILLPGATDNSLYCFTSQAGSSQHLISFPTYRGYFTGTGDMFSALVVARYQEQPKSSPTALADAVKRVVSTVNALTRRTWEHQKKHLPMVSNGAVEELDGRPSDPALVYTCELQMVKGKAEIENPDLVGKNVIKMTQLW